MNYSVQWLADGVDLPPVDYPRVEKWIGKVAEAHNRIVGSLTYIFCNDEKILQVNIEFLSHDYYTDIITFDNTHGRRISGDIFISLDTVRSNALTIGADPDTELLRVIIHGVLHLCGINDKAPGEREIMERHENEALAIYNDI